VIPPMAQFAASMPSPTFASCCRDSLVLAIHHLRRSR
jgi:hypothetical protein